MSTRKLSSKNKFQTLIKWCNSQSNDFFEEKTHSCFTDGFLNCLNQACLLVNCKEHYGSNTWPISYYDSRTKRWHHIVPRHQKNRGRQSGNQRQAVGALGEPLLPAATGRGHPRMQAFCRFSTLSVGLLRFTIPNNRFTDLPLQTSLLSLSNHHD